MYVLNNILFILKRSVYYIQSRYYNYRWCKMVLNGLTKDGNMLELYKYN